MSYIYAVYAFTNLINGNGFLSVYICGIIFANYLSLTKEQKQVSLYPFEYQNNLNNKSKLIEVIVPYSSWVIDKSLVELMFPENTLISVVCRGDDFIIPNGKVKLKGGDVLLVLVNDEEAHRNFIQLISKNKEVS